MKKTIVIFALVVLLVEGCYSQVENDWLTIYSSPNSTLTRTQIENLLKKVRRDRYHVYEDFSVDSLMPVGSVWRNYDSSGYYLKYMDWALDTTGGDTTWYKKIWILNHDHDSLVVGDTINSGQLRVLSKIPIIIDNDTIKVNYKYPIVLDNDSLTVVNMQNKMSAEIPVVIKNDSIKLNYKWPLYVDNDSLTTFGYPSTEDTTIISVISDPEVECYDVRFPAGYAIEAGSQYTWNMYKPLFIPSPPTPRPLFIIDKPFTTISAIIQMPRANTEYKGYIIVIIRDPDTREVVEYQAESFIVPIGIGYTTINKIFRLTQSYEGYLGMLPRVFLYDYRAFYGTPITDPNDIYYGINLPLDGPYGFAEKGLQMGEHVYTFCYDTSEYKAPPQTSSGMEQHGLRSLLHTDFGISNNASYSYVTKPTDSTLRIVNRSHNFDKGILYGDVVVDSFNVSTGQSINVSSLGGPGYPVFWDKEGNDFVFRKLMAGQNISVAEHESGNILISATGGGNGGGIGREIYRVHSPLYLNDGVIYGSYVDGDYEIGIRRVSQYDDGYLTSSDWNKLNNKVDTAVNLSNNGLFYNKSGTTLYFRGLEAGTGIAFDTTSYYVTISATGIDTAWNLAGHGLARGKYGNALLFKGLSAGTNISLDTTSSYITINSTVSQGPPGPAGPTGATGGTGATGPQGPPGVVSATTPLIFGSSNISLNGLSGYGTSGQVIKSNGSSLYWGEDLQGSGGGGGEANTASSLGGTSLVGTKSGVNLPFKGLSAGTGISLDGSNANYVTISATGSGGEVNTASNLGITGVGLFNNKVGTDLRFKRIHAGANVGVVDMGDYITISASGSNIGGGNEIDPVFSGHVASGITSTNITNWNSAFGWGNHASAGYITGGSNLGSAPDVGLFHDKLGTALRFKRLRAGADINITSSLGDPDFVTIGVAGLRDSIQQVRTLVNSKPNLVNTGTNTGTATTAARSDHTHAGLGGEANTGQNIGSGTGHVYSGMDGTALQFRTLEAGTGISIGDWGGNIVITNTAPSALGITKDIRVHVNMDFPPIYGYDGFAIFTFENGILTDVTPTFTYSSSVNLELDPEYLEFLEFKKWKVEQIEKMKKIDNNILEEE